LHQVCILINARHGITASDEQILEYLQEKCANRPARIPFSIQPVVTKVDELSLEDGKQHLDKITIGLQQISPACLSPILTSSKKPYLGIHQLRGAVVHAANLR